MSSPLSALIMKKTPKARTTSGHRHVHRPEPTIIDHQISLKDGSTSALDMTSSSLRKAKYAPKESPEAQVVHLTKQVGHLHQEAMFLRFITDKAYELVSQVDNVGLELMINYYLKPQASSQDNTLCYEVGMELHNAVDHFKKAVAEAEDEWLEFWGVKDRNLSHSQI